jgi:uncharacterized membrane protein YhaH (DUF805 family)
MRLDARSGWAWNWGTADLARVWRITIEILNWVSADTTMVNSRFWRLKMRWYFEPFKKYGDFKGRASRKEFWIFFLVNLLIGLLVIIPSQIVFALVSLYVSFILLPGIAVTIRRLHDSNKPDWHLFVILLPLPGLFILLSELAAKGDYCANKYGPAANAANIAA